jgi:Myb DNA-binding like
MSGTARVITDSQGQIIVDPVSLQADRHAIHPSTLTDSLVHTTETTFFSKVNAAMSPSTRTHASNNIRWFLNDNERFYTALQMFGMDFGMIAMFLGGGKSCRQVKNKFSREEKKNGDKLTWVLKNRIEVDVDVAALEELFLRLGGNEGGVGHFTGGGKGFYGSATRMTCASSLNSILCKCGISSLR